MSNINLYFGDCMEAMAVMKDKQYDLAIVDPPYGLDSRLSDAAGQLRNRKFKNLYAGKNKKWDKKPSPKYFKELFRISKNQIIWGGNYHVLPPTRGIIAWDKMQPWPTFSAWEMAWTSFDVPAKLIRYDNKNIAEPKIHPTQKKIYLYEWLLENYAKPGYTIVDTHVGSGSIAIACDIMGYDLDGWENDKEYYQGALSRLNNHRQNSLLYSGEILETKAFQKGLFE